MFIPQTPSVDVRHFVIWPTDACGAPSCGPVLALSGKPLQDIDQLLVRSAGRITKLVNRVRVGKPAQTQDLTDPLTPIEL